MCRTTELLIVLILHSLFLYFDRPTTSFGKKRLQDYVRLSGVNYEVGNPPTLTYSDLVSEPNSVGMNKESGIFKVKSPPNQNLTFIS